MSGLKRSRLHDPPPNFTSKSTHCADYWVRGNVDLGWRFFATTASAAFYLASRKLKFMVQHAIPSGLLYGVAVYIFMNYIVLPLSAYHVKIALPSVTDVAVLMCMVGLPISLTVRKYSRESLLLNGAQTVKPQEAEQGDHNNRTGLTRVPGK